MKIETILLITCLASACTGMFLSCARGRLDDEISGLNMIILPIAIISFIGWIICICFTISTNKGLDIQQAHQRGVIVGYVTSNSNLSLHSVLLDTQVTKVARDCNLSGKIKSCGDPYLKEQVIALNVGNMESMVKHYYENGKIVDVTYSCAKECVRESDAVGNCCVLQDVQEYIK